MNLINRTPFVADYTTDSDKNGCNYLLVVVKATYRLPMGGEPAQLMDSQVPLVAADTATGEPGLSAPEYECEFVLTKPRCDVLLLGSAYAPRGTPVEWVDVALKVGALKKTFRVHGKRCWQSGLLATVPGKATPFTCQALSYGIAFGGIDANPCTPESRAAYLPNPVGIGYHVKAKRSSLHGSPMAQTEAHNAPVTRPNKVYRPMGYGPLGRHWAERVRYAGTYDTHWEKEIFPFLPPDFDERYFQSAPEDQQLDALHGGETVHLLNLTHPVLTPSGRLDFVLPNLSVEVTFHPAKGEPETRSARADTLILEPDRQRFTVAWRSAQPLRRSVDEMDEVEIEIPVPGGSVPFTQPCCAAHGEGQ